MSKRFVLFSQEQYKFLFFKFFQFSFATTLSLIL